MIRRNPKGKINEPLYSVKDIAEVLGVCLNTVYVLVRDGKFPKPDGLPRLHLSLARNSMQWKKSTVLAYIEKEKPNGDD